MIKVGIVDFSTIDAKIQTAYMFPRDVACQEISKPFAHKSRTKSKVHSVFIRENQSKQVIR